MEYVHQSQSELIVLHWCGMIARATLTALGRKSVVLMDAAMHALKQVNLLIFIDRV